MKITCKKATEFIEKKHEKSLSRTENISLRIHLILCKTCRKYQEQSIKIEAMCQHYFSQKKKKLSPMNL